MLAWSLYVVKNLIQWRAVDAPLIGQRYRGVEGRSGFLLRQAWQELRAAMELALREHRLTPAQYGALSVLARDPGLSGADLARATDISAQSMNGVLASLERAGLVERRPHPTHGRIREVFLTTAGQDRLDAATPAVKALEEAIEAGHTDAEVAAVKAWLVESARRMEGIKQGRS
jgi:DNA-binding MarR family transcriptional regulator